ncbi:MAG: hypothetical protein JKX76_02080 [Colwellia sp.]|nr:hypothetical protein [Colwellia sp.]
MTSYQTTFDILKVNFQNKYVNEIATYKLSLYQVRELFDVFKKCQGEVGNVIYNIIHLIDRDQDENDNPVDYIVIDMDDLDDIIGNIATCVYDSDVAAKDVLMSVFSGDNVDPLHQNIQDTIMGLMGGKKTSEMQLIELFASGNLEGLKNRLDHYNKVYGSSRGGRMRITEWNNLDHMRDIKSGITAAAMNNRPLILEYMANTHYIFPIMNDMDLAMQENAMDVLDVGAALDPPVLPNQYSINAEADMGFPHKLEWAMNLDPPMLPSQESIDRAAEEGRLNVLMWAASIPESKGGPLYPDAYAIGTARDNGFVRVLTWAANLENPIDPE